MIKFILSPLIAIACLCLFVVTVFFLILHSLLKLGIKAANYLLAVAGYNYQLYLEAEKVEK